jgi:hypothetical protein
VHCNVCRSFCLQHSNTSCFTVVECKRNIRITLSERTCPVQQWVLKFHICLNSLWHLSIVIVVLHQYLKFSVLAIFYYKIKKLKLLERPVARIQIYIYVCIYIYTHTYIYIYIWILTTGIYYILISYINVYFSRNTQYFQLCLNKYATVVTDMICNWHMLLLMNVWFIYFRICSPGWI